MSAWTSSSPFAIALTLGAYALGDWLHKKTRIGLLHPVLVAVVLIAIVLRVLHVDVPAYEAASQPVSFFLGPSVVALGVVLFLEGDTIQAEGARLFAAIAIGSVVGIVSVVAIARALGASAEVTATLAPKSVTTPIAMSIAGSIGGVPSLTAVIVIFVGVFGAAVGPFLLRLARVTSPVAVGLALGASSHGVGTARATELGSKEGAASALAITLNGIATSLLTAPLLHLLSR